MIEVILNELFKDTTFNELLIELFLKNPRLQENLSKYSSGILKDFYQRYVVEKLVRMQVANTRN